MKTIVLLVALGWMLTFLHASWVEEKACRAKSTSVRGKSDVQAVTVINTDGKNSSHALSGGLRVSGWIQVSCELSGNVETCKHLRKVMDTRSLLHLPHLKTIKNLM